MGRCIGAWAGVDEQLALIFRACVGPPVQCAIIYYRTPGIDARISLVDEIVRSLLPRTQNGQRPDPSCISWGKLNRATADLKGIRRRIAHHPVHVSFWGKEDENGVVVDVDTDRTNFEIFVSQEERRRDESKQWDPLTLAHLVAHLTSVSALAIDLERFRLDVLPKHLPAPSAPNPLLSPETSPEENPSGQ